MTRRTRNLEPVLSYGLDIPTRTVFLDEGTGAWSYAGSVRNLWLLAQTPDPITIYMNHPGGSVIDGLALFDLISSLSNHVTIRVLGTASSMGSVVLQAADHRVAYPSAEIMLHDGQVGFTGLPRDFEAWGKAVRRDRERMYGIFAARTGKPAAYYRKKLQHDWFLTATEALKEGLLDEVLKL